MRLDFLPAAVVDLRSIELYLYRIDPGLADRFVKNLVRTAERIIERPQSYSPRDSLFPGLRAAKHDRYAIYFLPKPDTVEIVRILHERRDLPGMFDR